MFRLPDDLRPLFQQPFGPVLQTAQLTKSVSAPDLLVCVGDFVAKTALELGLQPKLLIVDFQTERHPIGDVHKALLASYGRTVLRVANPAATVTDALYGAVVQGLRLTGTVRIEVEGEEDLAGLPVFAEAPDGTVVLYGLPGRGVVVARLDPALRAKARALLDRMRVP